MLFLHQAYMYCAQGIPELWQLSVIGIQFLGLHNYIIYPILTKSLINAQIRKWIHILNLGIATISTTKKETFSELYLQMSGK